MLLYSPFDFNKIAKADDPPHRTDRHPTAHWRIAWNSRMQQCWVAKSGNRNPFCLILTFFICVCAAWRFFLTLIRILLVFAWLCCWSRLIQQKIITITISWELAVVVWVFAIILVTFVMLFDEPTFSIAFSSASLTSQTIASCPESHFFIIALILFIMIDLTASHPYSAMSLFRYSFTARLPNQRCYCFSSSFCSPVSLLCFSMLLLFIIWFQTGPGMNLKAPLGRNWTLNFHALRVCFPASRNSFSTTWPYQKYPPSTVLPSLPPPLFRIPHAFANPTHPEFTFSVLPLLPYIKKLLLTGFLVELMFWIWDLRWFGILVVGWCYISKIIYFLIV